MGMNTYQITLEIRLEATLEVRACSEGDASRFGVDLAGQVTPFGLGLEETPGLYVNSDTLNKLMRLNNVKPNTHDPVPRIALDFGYAMLDTVEEA